MVIRNWRENGKKEWKDVNKLDLTSLVTGNDWIKYVADKYCNCTDEQLKEFIRYLRVVKASRTAGRKFSDKVYTAIISSIITFIITYYANGMIGTTSQNILAQIIICLLCVCVFVAMLMPVGYCLLDIYFDLKNDDLRGFFLDSYIDIIRDIINNNYPVT